VSQAPAHPFGEASTDSPEEVERAGSATNLGELAAPAALLGVALAALALRSPARGQGHLPALLQVAAHPLISGPAAALSGAIVLLLLAGTLWAWSLQRQLLRPGVLGGARRARGRDLRALRAGRRPAASVQLGTHRRRSILLPGEEHLLVLGPTGAGKSSALAIPAILEWPGPVVVTDPKGELLAATLAARRGRGEVAVFAPLMQPSDRWNPISAVASSEDALRTASFLMGKAPEREPFWHDLALQLLHGLVVEAATQGRPLSHVLNLLQAVPGDELADEVSHPVARRLVLGALSGGDRTAMGVVATLVSRLGPYGTEQVAWATAQSSFDPAQIAGGSLGTIYCLVTPADAPLLRGLVSALLSCCWRAVYAQPPQVPVLFVLDEFAQLTFLPELAALVQLGRSQGARILLLAQDLASISAQYGAETTSALWANCRTKLLLPGISEVELLERVSKLAGATTVHGRRDGSRGEPTGSHPLLPPDEIRRLPHDRALVLHGGDQPALIRQRPWYRDARLRRLVGAGLPPAQAPRPARGRDLREWPAEILASSGDPLPWVAAGADPALGIPA